MQVSLDEAVEFVRSLDLMKGWSEVAIKNSIARAVKECALVYTAEAGKLTGLVFGYWLEPAKQLHVVVAAGNLLTFVRYLKELFPECHTLRAYRKGQLKFYKIGKHL